VGPVDPVSPVGPVTPVAPTGPVGPVSPVGPVGPVAPVFVVSPEGPVKPVLPVGPVAPRSPCPPCGPGINWIVGQTRAQALLYSVVVHESVILLEAGEIETGNGRTVLQDRVSLNRGVVLLGKRNALCV
jgi:hypothetical protein